MKIRDMQRHIEDSLGSLHETLLPPQIGGLRLLPGTGFRPKVSMYYVDATGGSKRRRVDEGADVTTFDPNACEIVIAFEPDNQEKSNTSKKPKLTRAEFNPIRIRGGMASDTVIEDRADRV